MQSACSFYVLMQVNAGIRSDFVLAYIIKGLGLSLGPKHLD